MDITTLAAWGEFIGGIAVVVSLIYLAGQIRQNSKLLKVSTTGAVATSDIDMNKLLIADVELHRMFIEGMADRDTLSEAERRRFDQFLHMIMRTFKRNYYFAQDGAINDSIWQGERQLLLMTLQQPGARQWWAETPTSNWFDPEFRDYVDGLIREGEAVVGHSIPAPSGGRLRMSMELSP
jgi:hypothetical protein